jgi:hypothetical protein
MAVCRARGRYPLRAGEFLEHLLHRVHRRRCALQRLIPHAHANLARRARDFPTSIRRHPLPRSVTRTASLAYTKTFARGLRSIAPCCSALARARFTEVIAARRLLAPPLGVLVQPLRDGERLEPGDSHALRQEPHKAVQVAPVPLVALGSEALLDPLTEHG